MLPIFSVSDSDPVVAGMEELVKKLNETNNLRAFFISMRKKYKEHIKK